eukprot:1660249-Rhodomonas_salina.2
MIGVGTRSNLTANSAPLLFDSKLEGWAGPDRRIPRSRRIRGGISPSSLGFRIQASGLKVQGSGYRALCHVTSILGGIRLGAEDK